MEGHEVLLVAILLLLTYYFLFVAQRPRVYGSNARQLEFVQKLKTANSIYYPTIFYFHGILQTIFGLSKRPKKRIPYRREVFSLKDGGELGLDFLEPEDPNKKSDILVIILPGLTSSSQTGYVKNLALSCVATGASVVIINNRGLGGVPLKTPRLFCATNFDDFKEVLDDLCRKYPNMRKIALGTSLGGIMLSHYLTKHGDEAREKLLCALLISVIWDAHAASNSIEEPLNKYFINSNLTESLKFLVKKHQHMLKDSISDIDGRMQRSTTLRKFDDNFTAPAFDYPNVEVYYDDTTVSHRIKDFTIPVFALNAADDPMQPGVSLPTTEAGQVGSKLVLVVTARGGHLGFLEGFLPISRKQHFMERFAYECLKEIRNSGNLNF